MSGLNAKVTVDFKPLKSYLKQFKGSPTAKRVYREWNEIYKRAMRRRYNTFSRGRGLWPKLAETTIKTKGSMIILRRNNWLYNATRPGNATGWTFKFLRPGVIVVGYSESTQHLDADVSFAQLVAWHAEGAGNLPIRVILTGPHINTKRVMANTVVSAMKPELKR